MSSHPPARSAAAHSARSAAARSAVREGQSITVGGDASTRPSSPF